MEIPCRVACNHAFVTYIVLIDLRTVPLTSVNATQRPVYILPFPPTVQMWAACAQRMSAFARPQAIRPSPWVASRAFGSAATISSSIKAADILRKKRQGLHVFSIDQGESVFAATKLMIDYNVGSLAVTRNGRVCVYHLRSVGLYLYDIVN